MKKEGSAQDRRSSGEYRKLEKRRLYKDFWLFNYSNRHLHTSVFNDFVLNFFIKDWFASLSQLIDKYAPEDFLSCLSELAKMRESMVGNKYNESKMHLHLMFANALVYSFHRQHINDGFIDIRYQHHVELMQNPLKKCTAAEIDFVKYMHEQTHRYGFLLFSVTRNFDSSILWKTFVEHDPDDVLPMHIRHLYPYPKKGEKLKGLQIQMKPYDFTLSIDWDCAIYLKANATMSHVKVKLDAIWDDPHKQVIGDANNFDVAFYVSREDTTKRYVLEAIKSQLFFCEFHSKGRIALPLEGAKDTQFLDNDEPSKRLKKFFPGFTSAVAKGDNLLEKHRDLEKDNFRRAIGLYHWDKEYYALPRIKNRNELFSKTIEKLRQTKPELLNYYRSGYTTPLKTGILGDTAGVHATVLDEMKEDYYVAKACIEHSEFMSNQDVRNKKRKIPLRR